MIALQDQLGRTVELQNPAKRIVSLVPSQTELLADLNLDQEVVGITRFCIHPEKWFKTKPRVGGTKDFKTDVIRSLYPDLILANKEENDAERLAVLMKDFNVWVSDIHTLTDALSMIKSVGILTARESAAATISAEIDEAFSSLKQLPGVHKRAVYLIWNEPVMCAGSDTFINDMMGRSGYQNACNDGRYPVLSAEQLQKLDPEVLLLSSEPFPFKPKHADRFKAILPGAEIKFVDGEMFSWYGSRLRLAPAYFKTLL